MSPVDDGARHDGRDGSRPTDSRRTLADRPSVVAFRLVRSLVRGHRRTFAVAVGGSAVFAVCTVLSSYVIGRITDDVIAPRFERGEVATATVVATLSVLVLVGLVRAAGVVVRRTWAGRTSWRVTETLTRRVVRHLADQPATWHRRHQTGDLITRAGVDAEAATAVLAPLPYATGVVVLLGVSTAWMFATDVVLGAIAVAVFPLLVTLNVQYQRRVERHYDRAQRELGRLSNAVHESFDGVHVVKAFGAEAREAQRLAVIADHLRDARRSAIRLRSVFEALLDGIPTVVNIGLLVVGAARIQADALSVGELLSVIYLFTLLVFPLRLIGYALSELPRSQAGWSRIVEVLDDPLDRDPRAAIARDDDVGLAVHDLTVDLGGRRVLEAVDLDIPRGTTVAVVGPTGAGKTTLLTSIAGLIERRRGTITVPHGPVLIVFQEAFLVAGTVRENITLGADVDDDEIARALRIAAAEFVDGLPAGLDTVVGERGVGLSGGQRQRIALCRALVRRPALLLLDDTTSALDPSTELRVMNNLRIECADTTVVAVASRPSTIALTDLVVSLDAGRVRAVGTHDHLVDADPAYRALVTAFEQDRESDGSSVPEAAPTGELFG